jgi:hypothetical protein
MSTEVCGVPLWLLVMGDAGSHWVLKQLHWIIGVRDCGWASGKVVQVRALITCRLDCMGRWRAGEGYAAAWVV